MKRLRAFSTFAAGFVSAVLLISGVAKSQHPLQKPGSSVIELTAPIHVSANATGVAPLPLGTQIRAGARLVCVTRVTSAPTGGSGQSLDVYYQHSCDDGQTWTDFAHVQFSAVGSGANYIPISVLAPGSTTVVGMSDGAMAVNTCVQGPLGNRIRIKYSTAMGTSSGLWSFQPMVIVD